LFSQKLNISRLVLLANNFTANLDQLEDFTHNLTMLDLSSNFTDKNNLYLPEEIMVFGKILPNVKHLTISLNNEGFEAVCRVWKSLKSLRITRCNIDINGFLGIQEGKLFRLPNITDLKSNLA